MSTWLTRTPFDFLFAFRPLFLYKYKYVQLTSPVKFLSLAFWSRGRGCCKNVPQSEERTQTKKAKPLLATSNTTSKKKKATTQTAV